MKITHSKFFKYIYFLILATFLLLTFHILYIYITQSVPKEYMKGGTLVQGSLEGYQYLPYLSDHSQDKLLQSFLYNACFNPIATGANIAFQEDLCDITTKDYKTFNISVRPGKTWSDGTPITTKDLYFTYNNVLKENMRNIKGFDSYQNVVVTSGDTLKVTFPTSTVDNKIFFTNYILPEHVLGNKALEYYLQTYGQDPVTSNCGKIQKGTKDSKSVVFELSGCSDFWIQNYQVKMFENQDQLKEFVSKNPKTLDLYLDAVDVDGYKPQKIIVNKFETLFFNTSSKNFDEKFRQAFGKIIFDELYTGNFEDYFVRDNFIFDYQPSGGDIKSIIQSAVNAYNSNPVKSSVSNSTGNQTQTATGTVSKDLPNLPNTVDAGAGISVYYLPKVDNSFRLKVAFGDIFDKVSVSKNGENPYQLQSFKKGDKSAIYNLSEKFNLKNGKNTFKFVGYNGSKQSVIADITVYYIDKPQSDAAKVSTGNQSFTGASVNTATGSNIADIYTGTQNKKDDLKIRVLYLNDDTSEYISDRLKSIAKKYGISDYFDFVEFTNPDDFDNKIKSKDYEIVIRGIDMGLKKDISTLFTTDDPLINPSMFNSTNFSNLINQYFITKTAKQSVKTEIDKIYHVQVPIILLGKVYSDVYVRNDAKLFMPERLYDFWFAKDYITRTKLVRNTKFDEIDRKKIFTWSSFSSFIKDFGFDSKALEE